VPKAEFKDFGYQFRIESIKTVPSDLRDQFKNEISIIDQELISYYFNLNKDLTKNYIISIENNHIGYCSIFEDEIYWNFYEIFIINDFRELGLGTQLFDLIKKDAKKNGKQIRTYTLPSDRTAKNFYESNRVTARALIMEEKRSNSRYNI
tara:strand:+ start:569 stop:1018 length:450 start_codon:yes stop_codon:yes gene_type:complete